MSYTLTEIVRNLEANYGRRWWDDPNHNKGLWNKRRLKWLEEHKDDNRKYWAGRPPGSYYEVTDKRNSEKAKFNTFRELKKHYLGKGGELQGVISGVESSRLRSDQARAFFSKYGYDLEIIVPKQKRHC